MNSEEQNVDNEYNEPPAIAALLLTPNILPIAEPSQIDEQHLLNSETRPSIIASNKNNLPNYGSIDHSPTKLLPILQQYRVPRSTGRQPTGKISSGFSTSSANTSSTPSSSVPTLSSLSSNNIASTRYRTDLATGLPQPQSLLPPPPPLSPSPHTPLRMHSESLPTIPAPNMNAYRNLSILEKIGFGFGHVYNDMCAGIWFSYTLLFLKNVIQLNSLPAGILIMVGQVSDAIATPLIGWITDCVGTKRKWHLVGSILVALTFPLIFTGCGWCSTNAAYIFLYFIVVIVIFQIGWPIVQITHLSMIPELGMNNKDRSDLTAIRYTASVCSNVIVYLITWLVLKGRGTNGNDDVHKPIGPDDAPKFQEISIYLTLIGVSMAVLFHFSISISGYNQRRRIQLSESQHQQQPSHDVSTNHEQRRDHHQRSLFRQPILYQNALLYVFSRLFMTTSLIYMPLWLNDGAVINQSSIDDNLYKTNIEYIAIIPLVSFLSSFVASIFIKSCTTLVNHEPSVTGINFTVDNIRSYALSYMFGSLLCIFGCVLIGYIIIIYKYLKLYYYSLILYVIAILFGAGSSITMISSLCITADMIGTRNISNGGLIYSSVTFADKLITGICVFIIEAFKCETRSECPEYYRHVLTYGCGVAAMLGIVTLLTILGARKWRVCVPSPVRPGSDSAINAERTPLLIARE